jgi:hypothetical protein
MSGSKLRRQSQDLNWTVLLHSSFAYQNHLVPPKYTSKEYDFPLTYPHTHWLQLAVTFIFYTYAMARMFVFSKIQVQIQLLL